MKERGYTLIEILISLLIFSLITGLISYAVSQGLSQYKGIIKKTSTHWDKAKIFFLNKSFASTVDYYVKEETWFPFFEGDINYIIYITEAPLAESFPVLVFIVREKSSNGKWKITYYEIPVYTLSHKQIQDLFSSGKYKKGNKMVLFNDLDDVKFEFFGQKKTREKPDWYSKFSGKNEKSLPMIIRFYLTEGEEKKNLFFFIKNNSDLKEIYNEIY